MILLLTYSPLVCSGDNNQPQGGGQYGPGPYGPPQGQYGPAPGQYGGGYGPPPGQYGGGYGPPPDQYGPGGQGGGYGPPPDQQQGGGGTTIDLGGVASNVIGGMMG